jgi:hypothetical protein
MLRYRVSITAYLTDFAEIALPTLKKIWKNFGKALPYR